MFEGFAREGLKQPELAMVVYRKASSLEPNQPLAWQVYVALCCYFLSAVFCLIQSHALKLDFCCMSAGHDTDIPFVSVRSPVHLVRAPGLKK